MSLPWFIAIHQISCVDDWGSNNKKKCIQKKKKKLLAGLWRPPDEPLWWLVFIHQLARAGRVGGPLRPRGTDLSVAMPPGLVHPSSFVTTLSWQALPVSEGLLTPPLLLLLLLLFNFLPFYSSSSSCYYYHSSFLIFSIFLQNIDTKLILTNSTFIYAFWN